MTGATTTLTRADRMRVLMVGACSPARKWHGDVQLLYRREHQSPLANLFALSQTNRNLTRISTRRALQGCDRIAASLDCRLIQAPEDPCPDRRRRGLFERPVALPARAGHRRGRLRRLQRPAGAHRSLPVRVLRHRPDQDPEAADNFKQVVDAGPDMHLSKPVQFEQVLAR